MPNNLGGGDSQINFRISEEKKEALLKKARVNEISVSRVLVQLIDEYLGITPRRDDEIYKMNQRIIELEKFKVKAEKILNELVIFSLKKNNE
ncbi:MAG: hypothetical protein PUP93_29055 [Rhizonema sp. NSF051]|nr:hypothetical protein [Rhizonema sp. NSF051]